MTVELQQLGTRSDIDDSNSCTLTHGEVRPGAWVTDR